MTRALVLAIAAATAVAAAGAGAAAGPAASPAPAPAGGSFDAAASGAEHVGRLEDLVWALTAPCTAGDDIEQRQCRHVRDARAAELARATLIVDADRAALEVGAWDPARRSVPLRLTACIRCAGIAVDGVTWRLVGAPHVDGGAVTGGELYNAARTFSDEATAKAWIASLAAARVELLVQHPSAAPAEPHTISFDVIGYRVVTPCDGAIVIARPAAAPLGPDKRACKLAQAPVNVEK